MSEVAEFGRLLGKRMKETVQVQTAYAICKSVDWEKKTMVATGQTDDLDYIDVKLGFGAEYKKPVVGALCLIGLVENQSANAFLIEASELEELVIIVGESQINIKDSGISLKRGEETFKTILNDFINEVNKIIVVNGTTINVGAVNAIRDRLNNVLIE